MKTNKLSIAFFILLFAIAGCTKDNKFKEVQVTEVSTLYSPDDGRNVPLQAAGSPSLYFEWEKAVAQDNGVVYYDVLFDKHDGDFSNPVFVVPADNNGTSTGASIPHKVLNKIGKLAGIASGKEGKLKWTVASSRGLTRVVSEKVRTINITRTNGIDAPDALFLTGEGTEGGTNLAQALTVKGLPGGNEFEIYTRLVAGKKYSFVDSRTNIMRTFSVSNGTTLVETADGGTVAKDGIYRIFIDFTNAAVTLSEITKLDFWMCTPQKRETLTYQGKGVWRVNNIVPDFTNGGFPDDRYFFWITIGGSEQKLGSINKDNQPPGTTTGSYFFTYFNTNTDRWDYSFKFPNRSVPKCSIVVSFSSDAANYSHEVIY
jgi:hypothetical protein